jgi:hypothetical protein
MRIVSLLLTASALLLASARTADAARCRPCAFGGLCSSGETLVECLPSQSACVPKGGILGFNSTSPNVPAYWTLFSKRRPGRSLRRLVGRLEVWSDYSAGPPSAPGLPEHCDSSSADYPICSGEQAEFRGMLRNDRLVGLARYPGGATCEFRAAIAFGDQEPNSFICRSPSGDTVSAGTLRVQLIRLQGCKRRPAR